MPEDDGQQQEEPTGEVEPTQEGGAPPAQEQEEQPKPPWGSDEEFDPEKAWKLIQNLRAEKDELKPLAAKAKELEDAKKTEQQKLAEQLEAAKSEGSEAKSEAAKLRAAMTHGLTADDLELLGDGTPEQIEQRAKRLAARLSSGPVVPASRTQGNERTDAPRPDVQKMIDSIPRP